MIAARRPYRRPVVIPPPAEPYIEPAERIERELPHCRWLIRRREFPHMPAKSGYVAVAVNTRPDLPTDSQRYKREQECGSVVPTVEACRQWIADNYDGGELFPETILGVTEAAWREWRRSKRKDGAK